MVRPGDVIDGRYRVETRLGEGGMGEVWRATHVTVGNLVALKVLKGEASGGSENAARFLREARSAGRLRGEHVCRVMDAGATETGQPYLVMELLEGEDISNLIARGPLPAARAARYVVDACEALAEAHALGMVHRDIKPANLFVARQPGGGESLKVLDFGIATAATVDAASGRLTSTTSMMGSPAYMSPEQMRSARDVDARSDVWALGVCLYEMLSNRLPFDGASYTALAIQVATEAHQPLVGVGAEAASMSVSGTPLPPGLVAVVERCLAKHPDARYADVAELAAALAPWLDGGVQAAAQVRRALAVPVAATMGPRPAEASVLGTQLPPPVVAPSERRGSQAAHGPAVSGHATTMGLTAGQSVAMPAQAPAPVRSKLWLVLGAVAAVAVAGAVAFVAVAHGGGEGGDAHPAAAPTATERPAAAAAPDPAAAPTVTPIPTPAVAPSPAPEAVTVTPSPVAVTPSPAAVTPSPVAVTPSPVPASHDRHITHPIHTPPRGRGSHGPHADPSLQDPYADPVPTPTGHPPLPAPTPAPPMPAPPTPVAHPPTPAPAPPVKTPCRADDPRCGL